MKYLFTLCIFMCFHLSASFGQGVNPQGIDYSSASWRQDGLWANSIHFNDYTPECNNKHAYIGCPAVATSQLLNYYYYPDNSITINSSYKNTCFSPLTNEWGYNNIDYNVTVTLPFNNPPLLMSIVGKTLGVRYGGSGFLQFTGTGISNGAEGLGQWIDVLKNSFDFDADKINYVFFRQYTKQLVKDEIIDNNLKKCQPVLLIGLAKHLATHVMLIEDYDENIDKFFVKYGAGSNGNKWVDIFSPEENPYSFDMAMIYNIVPDGYIDGCDYFANNLVDNPTSFKEKSQGKEDDDLSQKVVSCPSIEYPNLSLPIENNRIAIDWTEVNAKGFLITVIDLNTSEKIFNKHDTYLGHSMLFTERQYYPPNTTIEVLIEPYDSDGNITTCSPFTFDTAPESCSTNLDYINTYCINNGAEYMIEVEFSGDNVTYDLYADWDGTNYGSFNSVTPGFYEFGPYDINQDMGIIVEDEANPFNCFDNQLVIHPYNPTNCQSTAPPPVAPAVQASDMTFSSITSNSVHASWTRGSGDNVIITCTPCGQSITAPQDGISYGFDRYYSQSPQIGNSRIIHKGSSTGRTIYDLEPNSCYLVAAYEYNGTGSETLYQRVAPAQGSFNTSGTFALDFEWDPLVIVEDQPIDFDWISSLGSLSVEHWFFNGGSPGFDDGNGDNIYFADPGIYTITLEGYYGPYTQWETITKQIEVLSASAFEPDFTFTYGSLNPLETTENDNVFVDWGMVNQGVDRGKVTDIKYYLSNNSTYDNSDIQLASDYYGEILSGGESLSDIKQVTIPSGTSSGSKYILVEIESTAPLSGSAETNFANNWMALPITIVAQIADFTMQNISISSSNVSSAESFDATVTFANIGDFHCCPNNPCLAYDIYLSTDNVWSPDDGDEAAGLEIDNGSWCVSNNHVNNPGETFTHTRTISTQDITVSGNYYLIFVFDTNNEANEGNESNNVFAVPLTVSNPNQPTVQASNLNLVSKTSSSITLSWTGGNGSGAQLLAQKQGGYGNPIDGNDFASNTNWANAGHTIFPDGDPNTNLRAVYEGNGNQVTITGLSDETTWYFSLFEYNGSGSNRDYLQANSEFLTVQLGGVTADYTTSYFDGDINNLELYIFDLVESNNAIYGFGSDGFFLKSTDDGGSYEMIRLGEDNLTIIDAGAINNHVVAIGNKKVYVSADEGNTWNYYPIDPSIISHFALHLVSEQVYLIAGLDNNSNYNIYRSQDGGQTWGTVYSHSDGLRSFSSNPDGSVWACGSAGKLMRSYNGGITWTSVSNDLTTADLNQIQFVTENIGFACTNTNLFKTTDGGTTWDQILATSGALPRDHTIAFINADVGYVIDRSGTHSNKIRKTTDGGDSWSTYLTYTSAYNRGLVKGADDNIFWYGRHISGFHGCTLNTYYVDMDNDGFGSDADSIQSCSLPVGYADNATDCNDANPIYNPNNLPCPNCNTNVFSIPDDPVSNGVYHSTIELNSNGIVDPNSSVIFKSDAIIKLTDGFKANHYFKATIDGCQ